MKELVSKAEFATTLIFLLKSKLLRLLHNIYGFHIHVHYCLEQNVSYKLQPSHNYSPDYE